ncbi:MAG: Na+/H+-dicarboxylate symporter [Candidatus Midichloriaceae bacterium]|jgi:Na+/H+-dicarboxylate symporter
MKKYKLPLVLFLLLLFVYFFGSIISYEVKSFFFATSVTLKKILLFVLPFIIFSFISSSLLRLEGNVIKFVVLLFLCVFISNSIAIYLGYFTGNFFLDFLITDTSSAKHIEALHPMWDLPIPILISNEYALVFGFILGIVFSIKRNSKVDNIANKLSDFSTIFLKKIFIPILPLFVLGFIMKLQQEDVLEYAITSYGKVLLVIVFTQISYILFLYYVAAKFSFRKFLNYLKTVMPATITGFSTISSAASMSVLLLSMEKIFKNKSDDYKIIVPSVINIHTLGSAIGVTILLLATIKTFNMPMPSFYSFAIFAFFYAASKFAVAAVPGGVLIIVTPLLEKYLAFSPEMIGVITVVYLLFDPFGTATNVTANGGFTIIFSRIFRVFNKNKK